jgi:hypothetical protein
MNVMDFDRGFLFHNYLRLFLEDTLNENYIIVLSSLCKRRLHAATALEVVLCKK